MRLIDNLHWVLGERPGSSIRSLMEELEQRLRAHLVKAGRIDKSEEVTAAKRDNAVAHAHAVTIAEGGG